MRKLPLPTFDDANALSAVANNKRLKSFPLLKNYVASISEGYTQYHAAAGDADVVAEIKVPEPEASWLRDLYASPPTSLAEIDAMRKRHLALPCSMCGSMHANTLDHVFPKEDHPAFAVFTRNLVPACDCNLKKGTALKGVAAGSRVLHPYYDDCLNQPLYSAVIADPGPTMTVKLGMVLPATDPDYAAATFHLEMIVQKTGVLNWMREQWVKLLRHPPFVIGTLNFIPASEQQLVNALSQHLRLRDEGYGSPNNWESMFLRGLLAAPVTTWLFNQATAGGRSDPSARLVSLATAENEVIA